MAKGIVSILLVVLYILFPALTELDRSQALGIHRTRASPAYCFCFRCRGTPPQNSLGEALIARLNCIQTRWFSSLITGSGTTDRLFYRLILQKPLEFCTLVSTGSRSPSQHPRSCNLLSAQQVAACCFFHRFLN